MNRENQSHDTEQRQSTPMPRSHQLPTQNSERQKKIKPANLKWKCVIELQRTSTGIIKKPIRQEIDQSLS